MSVLTFAYGSNLNVRQLLHRCPGASFVAPARLYSHKLAFAGYSLNWKGAVATARRVPSETTYLLGLVWEIPKTDLHRLDRFEGYPVVYDRRLLSVIVPSGRSVQAYVYKQTGHTARRDRPQPSHEYLGRILDAYTEYGWNPKPIVEALAQPQVDRRLVQRKVIKRSGDAF